MPDPMIPAKCSDEKSLPPIDKDKFSLFPSKGIRGFHFCKADATKLGENVKLDPFQNSLDSPEGRR
jgi:hypothetical protein